MKIFESLRQVCAACVVF